MLAKAGEQYGRRNLTTKEPDGESRQATQDSMLSFYFSLKLRSIVHSFAGMCWTFSISGRAYFL